MVTLYYCCKHAIALDLLTDEDYYMVAQYPVREVHDGPADEIAQRMLLHTMQVDWHKGNRRNIMYGDRMVLPTGTYLFVPPDIEGAMPVQGFSNIAIKRMKGDT